MPVPDGAILYSAAYHAGEIMSGIKETMKRELRTTILGAIHRAVGDGMEVAEVADCLDELLSSVVTGHWLKEEP